MVPQIRTAAFVQVFGCLHDEAIHARQQQSSENLHKTGHRHDFGRMAAKLPTPEHWRAKATLPHLCWLRTGPTCLYGFGNLVNEKPRLSVAVRFVDECVTRVKVSDSTFADAKEIFSPGEIVEMTLLTGFYMGGVPDQQTLESAQAKGPTPQGAEEVCLAIGLLETIAILARPQ